ncbi:MAG: hypothetical protein JW837_18505 [Sedimentisphaerales bacterium]|nr:hypothetical protein [Sedimentisphaerales bacterium]
MLLFDKTISHATKLITIFFFLCLYQPQVIESANLNDDKTDISFIIKTKVIHKINPRIFGQFMERPSWGEIGIEAGLSPGTNKLQPEVLKLLMEMEIPVIRFPGGTDVDFMDWRDMIDNVPNRTPQRPISTGHRGHKVTNNFGYDQFLQFCEKAGADAIVVVNFRDGLLKKKPLKEAAMHAAALVAYCNCPVGAKLPKGMYNWPDLRAKNGRAKPYKVKYFQIGNETWAFIRDLKQIMHDKAPQFYAECLNSYIEAIRSVDPSIEIIVDGHDADMSGIFNQVFKQTADKVSYFATHFYTPWAITKVTSEKQDIPISKLSADEIWRAWIAVTWFDDNGRSIINYPGINRARRDGYKVAVTEWNWNGWWRHDGSRAALDSSFAKGLGAAGFLHAFMRAADVIELGCQSMLVGDSWGINAIRTDAKARISPFYMPTGQATMFYSKHHGENLLALESRNVPVYKQPYRMGDIGPKEKVAYIDALATADDKHVYFHAINRNFDKPMDVIIDISAFGKINGRAIHHIMQGRLNDKPEANEPRQIGCIAQKDILLNGSRLTVTLPNRSISCIEFTLK